MFVQMPFAFSPQHLCCQCQGFSVMLALVC